MAGTDRNRIVATPRLRLETRTKGEGPALLFLAGSGGDLGLSARVFESTLPSRFRVTSWSPRGLGRSDCPHGNWSMADFADDAIALMDTLGMEQADMIGESFGAMTAMEIAIRHPHRVRRLVLAAGSAGGAGGWSHPLHLLQHLPPEVRASQIVKVQDSRMKAVEQEDPSAFARAVAERVSKERRFLEHENNAEGYARLLAARAMHDCFDRLGGIRAPTTVIGGVFDMQAPPQNQQALAGAIADCALHLLEGGHGVLFDNPEAIAIVEKAMAGGSLRRP